jgi:L-rhamnose-H+ transport protein
MAADQVAGLLLVSLAGLLQGTFILPMTLTRRWQWEHSWAAFSVLGMLVFNWGIAASLIPGLLEIYRATPVGELWVLVAFGGLWGAGAVCYGLGMDRLGMSVGYPIIMGLVLNLGALIPLLLRNPADLGSKSGVLLVVGAAITIGGIVVVSQASGMKTAAARSQAGGCLAGGLAIAIVAGILCGMPNIAMNYAGQLKAVAVEHGVSEVMAPNAVWVLLYTSGCAINLAWCLGLMFARRNLPALRNHLALNLLLMAVMGLIWIGSFYLYGIGTDKMGKPWGGIVGWPVFVALAIVVGNLWGIWRGEWASAPPAARRRLKLGLAVLMAAIVVFGISSV